MSATVAVPAQNHVTKSSKTTSIAFTPHQPAVDKPKVKSLKLDPLRSLEPSRKKLSTVESQRIMASLVDTIKRVELVTALPYIIINLERFRIVLGKELVILLEQHKIILDSFDRLKVEVENTSDVRVNSPLAINNTSRISSASSTRSVKSNLNGLTTNETQEVKLDEPKHEIVQSMELIAKQMQISCKNIVRAFSSSPNILTAVLKEKEAHKKEKGFSECSLRSEPASELVSELEQLREVLLNKLLMTPLEEAERGQYLKEISARERQNTQQIQRLEGELALAIEDKENEICKKNEVIRRLQADLHQIEKFSDDYIQRTKSEGEKQEASDLKNSDGKKVKLQQEFNHLRTRLQTLTTEHRESELALRTKKFKVETQVENWIQKYDQDMGERQAEYEQIDAVYTEEKKQLTELEERFRALQTEYEQIQEERRAAREAREAAERERAANVRAATTIQAFWRSFKVRKALLAKKKKKGGGKKKKKK